MKRFLYLFLALALTAILDIGITFACDKLFHFDPKEVITCLLAIEFWVGWMIVPAILESE